MGVRSPLRWLGGKARKVKWLLPLLPKHKLYVEPFGGAASLLLAKPPAPVEVYNDLDSGLVNFFRVLRDPHQFDRFERMVYLTPHSREEHNHCRETWETCTDPVDRAYRWYVVARMSFSGSFGSGWGYGRARSEGALWVSSQTRLPEIHHRLRTVQVENNDYRTVLTAFDTDQTCFYCDPPYVPETRRSGEYRHEMTMTDHEELVGKLLDLRGRVLLTGYQHPIYDPLEAAGWTRQDFTTTCTAAGKTRKSGLQGPGAGAKQRRVESIWLSPNTK